MGKEVGEQEEVQNGGNGTAGSCDERVEKEEGEDVRADAEGAHDAPSRVAALKATPAELIAVNARKK